MRIFSLLAALLAACATAPGVPSEPVPQGRIVELRESFTCPMPGSRGLITVTRDGKAERVVFDGLEFELGKTKSTREQLTLSPKETEDLFRFVADSGWQKIPTHDETVYLNPANDKRVGCADCCSGAMLIKTVEGQRSIEFRGESKTAQVDALIKGVEGYLSHGMWQRVYYPWEKQR